MVDVFDVLERDWEHLAGDRVVAGRLGEVCLRAGGARTLGEVREFVRGAGPEAADRVLVALVARAVEGDDLAARVLLQLLLPGIRRLARQWWALGDAEERAAAALSAVFGRIRTYPLARRPARVAANVLMDAAKDLRRSLPAVVQVPLPDPWVHPARRRGAEGAGRVDPAGPAGELVEVLVDAVGSGLLGRADAELVARTRIGGERIADIAAQRRLRPRTLWDRRQRAEATLATANTPAHQPAGHHAPEALSR